VSLKMLMETKLSECLSKLENSTLEEIRPQATFVPLKLCLPTFQHSSDNGMALKV